MFKLSSYIKLRIISKLHDIPIQSLLSKHFHPETKTFSRTFWAIWYSGQVERHNHVTSWCTTAASSCPLLSKFCPKIFSTICRIGRFRHQTFYPIGSNCLTRFGKSARLGQSLLVGQFWSLSSVLSNGIALTHRGGFSTAGVLEL